MMMTKPRPQEEAAEETSTEKVSKKIVEPSSTEEHIENLEQRLTQLEPEKPPPEIVAKRRKQSALLARIQAAQEKARIQKEQMEKRKKEEEAMLAALEEEIEAAKKEEEAMLSDEEASTTAEDDDEEVIDEQEEAGDVAAATTTESPPPSAPPLEHLNEENPDYSILLPEKSEEKTPSYDIEALKDIRTPSPEPNIEYKMESTLTDEEHARLVEDQLRILESIKLSNENATKLAQEVAASDQQNVTSKQAATAQPAVPTERGATRTVQISGGQTVPLHGQEKTREAIAKGTAILVQCISCQNWMQVTETANLMFCPVCSVVSPVQKQSHIMTKEDALRETMDRRMAEQLQNEEWKAEEEESKEGWLSWMGLKREQTAAPTQQSGEATKTWGEWLGIGVKKEEETKTEQVRSRPGQMHDVLTGEEDGDEDREREGLLQARVAERKPLYSCVMESVTSVASSLGKVVAGDEEDEEGYVHGVNAEPLLVTSAGREKDDNTNEYSSLTLNEERR